MDVVMGGVVRVIERMVVDRAIARIQQELEERVRVRPLRAGPHLHRQQAQADERQSAHALRQPSGDAERSRRGEPGAIVETSHHYTDGNCRVGMERTTARMQLGPCSPDCQLQCDRLYRSSGVWCKCEAPMLGGDPVCLHRAAYWYAQGVLTLDPEPEPPAPAALAPVVCWHCQGAGQIVADTRSRYLALAPCPTCGGTGMAALTAQAAALREAAGTVCGLCLGAGHDPEAEQYTVCSLCNGSGIEPAAPEGEDAEPVYVGTAGHIHGYDVFISGDTLRVSHDPTGRQWRHTVPNYGTSIGELAQRPGLRLGWGLFQDDAEAIYLYDTEDGNFGYAFNLSDPALSEWGYAPFTGDEDERAALAA
jgi:hypothetical protein